MQNVNVKKSAHKIGSQKSRAPRLPDGCEGIPEFMIRLAKERHVKISEEPTMPKYRHD